VTFNASDPSGISGAQLLVDGSPTASVAGTCDYTRVVPCMSLAQTFTLETTRIPDGAHMATLQVENAAGNITQVTHEIVIDNTAPAAPVGLAAALASDGSYTLAWNDPLGHAAPIVSATYQFCLALGPCSLPEAGPDGHIQGLHPPAGATTARVWLTDAAGQSNPSSAATAALPRPEEGGSPRLPELRLHHHLRGHALSLTATVPGGVRGPVTFAYIALRGRHRLGQGHRHARIRRGRASVAFSLSHSELKAQVLSISVSATGASSAAELVRLVHQRPHRKTP
jgi:hypothetical protein